MALVLKGCIPIVNGRGSSSGGGGGLGLEEYHSNRNDAIFSTNSTVFVSTGKTLVTPVVPAGTYRLGHWCQMGEMGGFSDAEYNVDLDGGGFVWPTTPRMFAVSSVEFWPWYRERTLNLTAAAHTFTVQLRSGAVGETALMRTSLLELWRQPPTLAGDTVDPCRSATQNLITTFVAAGRVVTARTLVTPVVAAGRYRIRCDWIFERDAGNHAQWNLALDGVDMLAQDSRENLTLNRFSARSIVLETDLTAAAHTFALVADSPSSTTYTLGQTAFYFHQVP